MHEVGPFVECVESFRIPLGGYGDREPSMRGKGGADERTETRAMRIA